MRPTMMAVLVMLALGACAVSEDRPDLSCDTDGDCFQAQGETCDVARHVCVGPALTAAGVDAGAASSAPEPAAIGGAP